MDEPLHTGADADDPDFSVHIARRDGEAVIALAGEFDMAGIERFEAVAGDLDGASSVVVDLRRLSFLDSSGLGCLMRLDRRARAGGSSVRLEGPQPAVQALLTLCGFDRRVAIVP